MKGLWNMLQRIMHIQHRPSLLPLPPPPPEHDQTYHDMRNRAAFYEASAQQANRVLERRERTWAETQASVWQGRGED